MAKPKMFTRLVVGGVVVVRDGQRVKPKAGSNFDFTQEELDHFRVNAPRALKMPTAEDPVFDDGEGEGGEEDTPAEVAPKTETAAEKKAREAREKAAKDKLADDDGGL